jgi:hypothetical protein
MSISPVLDFVILIAALNSLMLPFLAIIGKNYYGNSGKKRERDLSQIFWKFY